MNTSLPIGFFDSGIGGLSVLSSAVAALPQESFLYFGDSSNAPYGTKTDAEVLDLSLKAVEQMARQGIKALVIACNTATGVAVEQLRARYQFPIIGLEPALKLAEDSYQHGKILVLATPLTLSSVKFQTLFSRYGAHAINLPCPGLMDFVEKEELHSEALDSYLQLLFAPYLKDSIDSVVLGCTHYLFIREVIKAQLPHNTRILDSNEGVVRQLCKKLDENGLLTSNITSGKVNIQTSGSPAMLAQMQRMFTTAQQSAL